MISINSVSFRYPGSESWVLKEASVDIEQGEFTAIIGGNGAGKSTLCKTLNGLIPSYYVGDFEGTVMVDGLNAASTSVAVLSEKVAYVYQDFENQLVRPTVLDEAIFSPLNFGYPDYMERGREALRILGLSHLEKEHIWQLSGGQKHLVALAGALSLQPEILIIDEPVAQLDPAHAIELYDKLRMLNEEYNKTIIVIEHHTEFIANYCSSVIMMEQGSVLWKKPVKHGLSLVEELMDKNIHPPQVTQAMFQLKREQKPKLFPITVQEAKAEIEGKYEILPGPHLFFSQVSQVKGVETITMDEVDYGYKTITRKRKSIINELSLTCYEGERIALVGSNGAGKSTLLKMISGLVKPQGGSMLVNGQSTSKLSMEQLAEKVAYIYQNPEEMFIEDSIYKDIDYFLKARKIADRREFIEEIIQRFHLEELRERDGRLLSGGQQRRASLAIGIAMKPSIVLLDEPTASLDIATRKDMMKMLNNLNGFVKTAIVATHDMELVAEWASRVIVLKGGIILDDTTPHTLFSNPALLREASLVAPQIVTLSKEVNMYPAAITTEEFLSRVKQVGVGGGSVECVSKAL